MIRGNILITGGTGTLATAILRQAREECWDAAFTLLGRSELRLYQQWRRFSDLRVRTVIGDVRDADTMHAVVAGHDVVIHAAALKRIPECEQQPDECYRTNVLGSQHVAQACRLRGVTHAIAISTDKACAATTTYGASKLLMESLWRAAGYTAVRYGNVVASNGSVIPLWRRQHARGEALTITDRHMTRFWMAPRDAVALIVHAYQHPIPGGIWIPRMAALPVVMMAQYVCPRAVWRETGVRATEKRHEDLVHASEPVRAADDYLLLCADGTPGMRYTSDTAPMLTASAFATMLADAEALETL